MSRAKSFSCPNRRKALDRGRGGEVGRDDKDFHSVHSLWQKRKFTQNPAPLLSESSESTTHLGTYRLRMGAEQIVALVFGQIERENGIQYFHPSVVLFVHLVAIKSGQMSQNRSS